MEDQAQQHNSFPPRVPHTPPMEEDEPFTLLETPRRFQELFSLEDVGTGLKGCACQAPLPRFRSRPARASGSAANLPNSLNYVLTDTIYASTRIYS
jgi:hypothetical protein